MTRADVAAVCPHPNAHHSHGTRACYVHDRCRCDDCRRANREYARAQSRRNLYGRADLVDAEPVRAHIAALRAAGLGRRRIIAAAGVSDGAWSKLIYGVGDRPPARRVRRSTAAAYLAIPLPTSAVDLAAHAVVDSGPTSRRVQALVRIGWTVEAIARGSGLDRQRVDGALRGRPVLAETAVAVARLFALLWDKPAPAGTRRERYGAGRSRRRAIAAGWVAPLGWEDIEAGVLAEESDGLEGLDEIAVAELVLGRPCVTGIEERRAAVELLNRAGLTAGAIAARVGVTTRTVQRWRADRQAAE